MKIEVLKENLKKAINICERITRKVTTLPALQNVLMEADGNFLQLTTTNLETTIRWGVLAKVSKKGRVAVPATFFANLVGLIASEKVALQEDNQNLMLVSENQEMQIQGQDPEEFPIVPKIEKNELWQITTEQLSTALTQVVDVPSVSQIRPEISGIYFNLKDGKLKLVATDSFRLAEKTVALKGKTPQESSFILPQTTGRELLNIFSQESGNVQVYTSPNQVLFELEGTESSKGQISVLSRLIEGNYPNYEAIIPKSFASSIRFNKEGFANQIKKAGLFSGKVSEVKLTTMPQEGKLKIFSQSSDTGRNEAYFTCQAEGKEVEVAFNYRFLLDGLNCLKSSEVMLELSEGEGPGVLKPVGDDSFIYILMPIKAT